MPDFPVKDGATCGGCGGPVNAFGCVAHCAESREWEVRPKVGGTAEEKLAHIARIAEIELRSTRPEFVAPAVIAIYEIAATGDQDA